MPARARQVAAVTSYAKNYEKVNTRAGVDWNRLLAVAAAKRNIPEPIGAGAPSLAEITAGIKAKDYEYAPYGVDANDAALPGAER